MSQLWFCKSGNTDSARTRRRNTRASVGCEGGFAGLSLGCCRCCKCLDMSKNVLYLFDSLFTVKDTMLWSVERMTEHYRLALLSVLAGLFVMAGLGSDGAGVETLPRAVRLAILLVLRPAEAAARRIIFMRARGIEVPDYVEPPAPKGRAKSEASGLRSFS